MGGSLSSQVSSLGVAGGVDWGVASFFAGAGLASFAGAALLGALFFAGPSAGLLT